MTPPAIPKAYFYSQNRGKKVSYHYIAILVISTHETALRGKIFSLTRKILRSLMAAIAGINSVRKLYLAENEGDWKIQDIEKPFTPFTIHSCKLKGQYYRLISRFYLKSA